MILHRPTLSSETLIKTKDQRRKVERSERDFEKKSKNSSTSHSKALDSAGRFAPQETSTPVTLGHSSKSKAGTYFTFL